MKGFYIFELFVFFSGFQSPGNCNMIKFIRSMFDLNSFDLHHSFNDFRFLKSIKLQIP